jgi:CubicO group peptidase (beta-lactamase class C family)
MRRRDFLAAGLGLPSVVRSVTSAAPRRRRAVADQFNDLAQLVEQRMREYGIPGASFGVIKNGELQMRGFGIASTEDPRPITPDTVYELASLSKTVTATAAMRLVELGKFDLDAPVRRYLPGFRVQDEQASAAVTLRNLLTHSPGWEANYTIQDLGRDSLRQWVGTTGQMMQLAPPGKIWSYNNPGFGLTGHLIELATAMDIRDAFRELVFNPIGLERASAHLTEIITWPLSVGHRPGRNGAVEVVRPYSMGSSIPAGGVHMSLANLMKYAGFHLGDHNGTGATAISGKTRESMRVAQLRKEPTGEEMGIGWHLRSLNGVLTAAHGGTAPAGHRCHLQIVPERRLGFAILTNHTEGWRLLQAVERATLKAYEGLALTPNQPICGYRGHTETLDHVTPLTRQPVVAEYVGQYRRGRGSPTIVKAGDPGLIVGDGDAAQPIVFYGPDLAFGGTGPNKGINHEFIREGGRVRWIRIAGQIARKENT